MYILQKAIDSKTASVV